MNTNLWEIASGRPAPTQPTDPGLYVIEHATDLYAAAVYRRDPHGYWDVDGRNVTLDEVAVMVGYGRLVPLVKATDADI